MPTDLTLTLLSAAIILLFVSKVAAAVAVGLAVVNQALVVFAITSVDKPPFDRDAFDETR